MKTRIYFLTGVLAAFTLITAGCLASPVPEASTQTVPHSTPTPEITLQETPGGLFGIPQRLRITNQSTFPLHGLVVRFPDERIEFGEVPAGATTGYQEVALGVYRYAAYDVEVKGQKYQQPVVDWVGETPMPGATFTYILGVDPAKWEMEGQVIQLIEVLGDQPTEVPAFHPAATTTADV